MGSRANIFSMPSTLTRYRLVIGAISHISGLVSLPALVRRTAVETREAGFGFFGLDRGGRDHLRCFFLYSSQAIIQSSQNKFASPKLSTAHLNIDLNPADFKYILIGGPKSSTNMVSTLIKSIANGHVSLFDHLKALFRHGMRIGVACFSYQRQRLVRINRDTNADGI